MFKKISIALVVIALGALAGCAQFIAGVNSTTAALSSPQATQAAANVKAVTLGITCAVASTSGLLQQIQQLGGGKNNALAVRDEQTVCVAAAATCNALGGSATIATCTAKISTGS